MRAAALAAGAPRRDEPAPRDGSSRALCLTTLDSTMACEQGLGALHHRHVDHLAVDRDRADALRGRLLVGHHHALRVDDVAGLRTIFLVQVRALPPLDPRGPA